jgi:energy-coupling factor transporter ATP-binding protein EcfA2
MGNDNSALKETFILLKEIAQRILDIFGTIQTCRDLIILIVLMLCFIVAALSFRRRINKCTKDQIKRFISVGKYEPDLYIELNNNLENFRYFLFSRKWKARIVREYNNLFSGYDGVKLKKALGRNFPYRISRFSSLNHIYRCLNELKTLFYSIREEREEYRQRLGEYFYIVSNLSFIYIDNIDQMLKRCDMMREKSVLLIGSAGNGKSTLLCKFSEVAVKNHVPVMLINARDINKDCTEFVLDSIPIFSFLKKFSRLYLRIISFGLFIQKKHFYIVIDALNENDNTDYIKSIGAMLDRFARFHRIRFVLSCRSEYFQSRYKKYFESCTTQPYCFDIMSSIYSDRAKIRTYRTYCDYFNFSGYISKLARDRLFNSLLLMRIFFEVNRNRSDTSVELRNAELFNCYLKQINSKYDEFNFSQFVMNVAKTMVSESRYDWISMERLGINKSEQVKLFQILDNNLIISRTLQSGQGITENEEEVVAFVFDEFRDFCLAKYLLKESEYCHDCNYTLFFDTTSKMYLDRQSPVEGVVKYGYYYFKKYGHHELSNKILEQFSETDIQGITENNLTRERQVHVFSNFGLSLIFIDGGELIDSERAFLSKYIAKCPENYWKVFWFLLHNEYFSIYPRLDLGIKLLLENDSFSELSNTINFIFRKQLDYGYRGLTENNEVKDLCKRVAQIKSRDGLSIELKQFMLLLYTIGPYEPELQEYKEYAMDETVINSLLALSKCPELKELLAQHQARYSTK